MTNKKEVLDNPTKDIPYYSSAWENYPEKEVKRSLA